MTTQSSARPAVLRGLNRPEFLRDERLADILSATAARRPHHPALVSDGRTVTYRGLDDASDAVAYALARHGVTCPDVVGLFLPRGADALIAQVGITKSGAAWLPFDADVPLERLTTCIELARAVGIVTSRMWAPRLAHLPVPVWTIEDLLSPGPRETPPTRPAASDPAYVIFTSGSTGQPKGVVISHRSICHLLRSENNVLGVREDDLVYQGFSLAFDMSFEEIWIAYLVGATLWVAPAAVAVNPDEIARAITRARITVLHTVPTLMGIIDDVLPTVRLINLGGEACPEGLVDRLARDGRRIFNTYGPTEATVSATAADVRPGEPVTIGAPLPNYGVVVIDEHGRPRALGESGELCIFGPGVSLGYLGRPDLTADRFVDNPVATTTDDAPMYRSGDLASIEPNGTVRWLGRVDNQIKIRGFRVELDEIARALGDAPGVSAAAAVARTLAGDSDGPVQIVGFITRRDSEEPDVEALRRSLAGRLPHYMVPVHIERVRELPRLTSGKIDTKALAAMPLSLGSTAGDVLQGDEDERALYSALATFFPPQHLRDDADFFDDLGGHSLLVAQLVSRLRGDIRYGGLSVGDVYRERRLGSIARVMRRLRTHREAMRRPSHATVPVSRRFWCGLAQATVVPAFILFRIADWLTPFFVYHYFTGDEGDSIPVAVLYALATFVLARLLAFGVAIAGKRFVGRLPTGEYPLWGTTYFRWWLAEKFMGLPDVYLLSGTPWMPLYLRALGANVGRDVLVDSVTIGAPELLTIEDGVSIGTFVNIENARVEGGRLIVGPVRLEREAVVDSYAVLENDTAVGQHARLGAQSAVAAGGRIPAGEHWDGAPARPSAYVVDPLPPRPAVSAALTWALALASGAAALGVSVLFFLPAFPAFMLIDWVDVHTWDLFDSAHGPIEAFGVYFLLAIPASLLLVGLTILLTATLRAMLPRQTDGLSSIHSVAYWRTRFVTLILDASLDALHGVYASVFAPLWFRSVGATVGRHAELSTAAGLVPELLTIGDDSFVGDGAVIGDVETRGGWMLAKPTRVGHRTFIGNGAYIAHGTDVPDDVLIGVQTRVPATERLAPGQTWMGSPPFLLPAREHIQGFPESLTFRPSWQRQWARGAIEALRIVLPPALIIAAGYVIVRLVIPLTESSGVSWPLVLAALAAAGCLYGVASYLLVVALKWTLVGRYRPRAAPMWTPFVWVSEAITNVYESLAVPNALDILRGTPMLPWALRLLGADIGRGVYLNTTDLTEFDCVSIGDEAELNAWCGPQTHLFEDRVMKIGRIAIGRRVTVGARSTILYDTRIGDDVRLGPLTLVAKGEELPPETCWEGTPAAPVVALERA